MVTTAGYLSPNPFFAPVKPTFQTAHSRSSPVASNPPPYRRRSLSEKLKSGDLEHEVVIQTPRTPTNSTVTAPARGSLEPSLLDEDNSIVPEDEVASGVHSQSVLYNQATWESSPLGFRLPHQTHHLYPVVSSAHKDAKTPTTALYQHQQPQSHSHFHRLLLIYSPLSIKSRKRR